MGRQPARAFASVTAPKNLRRAYVEHVSLGRARGRDGVSPVQVADDLENLLSRVSIRLRTGTYEFTQFRQLLLSKGAGKPPRVISVPTARDRIALKALANFIVEVFPGTRPTLPQSVVAEVSEAVGVGMYHAYAKIDIEEFYPSVPHSVIERQLSARIRKKEPRAAILSALRTPTVADRAPRKDFPEHANRGVPQGLSISNLLAELVVLPVDRAMAQHVGLRYFRFVDDVLILCSDEAQAILAHKQCSQLFAEVGLKVHGLSPTGGKSSLGKVGEGFDYLGYVFKDGHVSVRRSSVHRLESALARSFTAYKRSMAAKPADEDAVLQRCIWAINLTVTGCTYKGTALGWMQYFRQMNDLMLLKQLDATMGRFAKRFGMPSEFRPKTFMRAYWAVTHPRESRRLYIPNFDEFDLDRKRQELAAAGVSGAYTLSDLEAEQSFSRMIDRAVRDLEKDIGAIS